MAFEQSVQPAVIVVLGAASRLASTRVQEELQLSLGDRVRVQSASLEDPHVIVLTTEAPSTASAMVRPLVQRFPHSRVVIWSGHAEPSDVQAARDAGAAAWLIGPIAQAPWRELIDAADPGGGFLSNVPLSQAEFSQGRATTS